MKKQIVYDNLTINPGTHTPGEWQAKDGQIYPTGTGKTLALIPYYDKDDKEQEANARLIAAAPDLLAALEKVFCSFPSYGIRPDSKIYKQAQAAIQKATA